MVNQTGKPIKLMKIKHAVITSVNRDELKDKVAENATLSLAQSYDMKFKFISRTDYRKKEELSFIEDLEKEFNRPLDGTERSVLESKHFGKCCPGAKIPENP